MTRIRRLDVEGGPARLLVDEPAGGPGNVRCVLVLGHGAGGGPGARDLVALAGGLPSAGVLVLRFEQPWVVAGRRVAAPPPRLDLAWLDALDWLRSRRAGVLRRAPEVPLVVGGRSAGARVACRTAVAVGAVGCLALAFPLHPPGHAERSRGPELDAATVPTLILQGERDAFGGPPDIPTAPHRTVVGIAGADHGFRGPVQRHAGSRLEDLLVRPTQDWLDRVLAPG